MLNPEEKEIEILSVSFSEILENSAYKETSVIKDNWHTAYI